MSHIANNILVVDDDEAFRRVVQATLDTEGFKVIAVTNGEDGLRQARALLPDLILSDLYMVNGDGYELLKSLAQTPETACIPVIIMTGQGDIAEARHGMELGADDFLLKPFSATTLLATVHARLNRHETQRQQSEHLNSRLAAILEATPDLVGILDASYAKLIYLNKAGRMMLGFTATEDLSQLSASTIHPPEVLDHLVEHFMPVADKAGGWSGETTFCDRQGVTIPFSQVILPQKGVDGRVEYLATVARDIRREKEAQKERNLMEVQLRHAQKLESIGQLAAGIAHEINTPTQYIGDNIRFLQTSFQDVAQLLARYDELIGAAQNGVPAADLANQAKEAKQKADLEYLTVEIPKAIRQSLEGVERVAKIVRAMKEFSHPGTHHKTPTDLNRAIESTLTVARNEWKYVANVETDFDATLPPVPCLPGEFNQVILNLVINASHAIADVVGDASHGKGTIAVSTRRLDPWVEIRIRDTGSGIPEKIKDKIFEPFFTTKPVGKGTGQGLAIARSVITDKHGGTIHFESEPGRGTAFIMRLPLTPNKTDSERRP